MNRTVKLCALALVSAVLQQGNALSQATHNWDSNPNTIAFSFADRTKFEGANPSILFSCHEIGREVAFFITLDRKNKDMRIPDGGSEYIDGPILFFDADNPSDQVEADIGPVTVRRDRFDVLSGELRSIRQVMELFSRAPNTVSLMMGSERHDISAKGFTKHYRRFMSLCRIR